MIELISELIAIPSISRDEKAVADHLEARLHAEGFDIHRTGNNLWMESEPVSSKPTLLLNAHLDTVRPAKGYTRDPFTPVVEDGRLYGLGSNDDGASLVSLLETYRRLSAKEQPYRLVWSATAEEEVTGTGGLEMIFPEIGEVALGIIGEPTGMQMAVAERGLMVLDCTAHGKSGHAAREEGINALYKAMDDIAWIRSYSFPQVSEYSGAVKMSVTMINCGSQHNVVPDTCSFVVDVRSNGLYSNVEILDVVREHVGSDVVPRSTRHNGSSISLDHPVVKKGIELGLSTFGSPTTSNQTVCGFTTLKIGPGQSSRSHTADEYIVLSELDEAVEIYCKLLDGLCL